MKNLSEELAHLLDLGGMKKDVTLLEISGIAVLCSLPIILDAVIGLVTAFDIKADVLVSLALIASICIGQDFTAGEVAFIMQLGALLEELPHLIALSRHMMTVIKINMTFSMALNFLAIVPAIIGTLNPVVGALVHNVGSVPVITNSAFLLTWRKRRRDLRFSPNEQKLPSGHKLS